MARLLPSYRWMYGEDVAEIPDIEYVGGAIFEFDPDTGGAPVVHSLTALTGGSETQPAEGDLILAAFVFTTGYTTDVTPTLVDTGYTLQYHNFWGGAFQFSPTMWTKTAGATPDTSITTNAISTAHAAILMVKVFRNVDETNPISTNILEAGNFASAVPPTVSMTAPLEGTYMVALASVAAIDAAAGQTITATGADGELSAVSTVVGVEPGAYMGHSGPLTLNQAKQIGPFTYSGGHTGNYDSVTTYFGLRPANEIVVETNLLDMAGDPLTDMAGVTIEDMGA